MKKLLLVIAIFSAWGLTAQNIKDSSIQVGASHNAAMDVILLNWSSTDATGFQINRKIIGSNSWGSPLASVGGSVRNFNDSDVQKGVAYEYRILKVKGNTIRAVGYVAAGIELPLRNFKNNILLLIDSASYAGIDSNEWNQFRNDFYMDGYGADIRLVSASATPPQVKAIISAWYNVNRNINRQCLLLGRIPVAYSGLMQAGTINLPPDAHPDHGGAWPTDLYYAEMDGNWTDNGTMTAGITRTANQNNPGDGKFDQHFIPSDIDIQIGRVDFRNLPAQGKTEIEMLRQYLRKLHRYKTGQVSVPVRAFISDNFGYLGGEMPMRSGWNNASALVGNNIRNTGNFFDSSKANAYLYANVMGAGSFSTCSGVGSASQFKDSILSVFNVSFGSYFGNWDVSDNFLRSCIASKGLTLTNVWAHRPHWYFHQMALGMQIGNSVINAQNNLSDFTLQTSYLGSFNGTYLDRRISMNLMGDPTLRVRYFDMPKNLNAVKVNGDADVTLTWTASSEPGILGYHVYRTNKKDHIYYPLTTTPITGLMYTDTDPYAGTNYYVVKAVKLEYSNAGSYMNSSLGVMTEVNAVLGTNTSVNTLSAGGIRMYPNPAQTLLTLEASPGSSLLVFDMNGKLIFSDILQSELSEINTSAWSKGIYFVRTSLEGRSETAKLIIQ